jgi:NTP pyrophosphatase (non-canonical NTP hydrolase)
MNKNSVLKNILKVLDKNKRIFKNHIKKYGYNRQLTVLAEECNELSKACLKLKRHIENNRDFKEASIRNFHEEYLDVLIMLYEFEHYLDEKIIDIILPKKIKKGFDRVGY